MGYRTVVEVAIVGTGFKLPEESVLPPPGRPRVILAVPPFITDTCIGEGPVTARSVDVKVGRVALGVMDFLPPGSEGITVTDPGKV